MLITVKRKETEIIKTHNSERNIQKERQANSSPKAMAPVEGSFLNKLPNTAKSVTSGHIHGVPSENNHFGE